VCDLGFEVVVATATRWVGEVVTGMGMGFRTVCGWRRIGTCLATVGLGSLSFWSLALSMELTPFPSL
jgi:hypothetical protein